MIQAKLRLILMSVIVILIFVLAGLGWMYRGSLNIMATQDGTIASQKVSLESYKIISQATSNGMMEQSEKIRGLEMANGIITKGYLDAIDVSTQPCLDEPVVDRSIIGVFFVPNHGGDTGANVPASNVDE